MIAKVESACLAGLEVHPVMVEVSLTRGLPNFSIVGLPDTSVREARDRVVAAIRNTGFEFPSRRVTVNLSPAELPKEGSAFDLAIAIGVLLASEALRPPRWPRCVWLGELALDGGLRPVRGALALARGLRERRALPLVVPAANLSELSALSGLRAYAFQGLGEVVAWLNSDECAPPSVIAGQRPPEEPETLVDMADIKGQVLAKRALEIAAAGHHNILLSGCPGTGKSMLAQALPALLPAWDSEEALEATQVHSIADSLPPGGILGGRPFRSPHHSVSTAALIGGGKVPKPGEISLAHRGVLFLDEVPEFRRDALEALRQPVESGRVHIQRARGRAVFPCEFLLVAAMNPCPCGYRGHPVRECVCMPTRVQKYMGKISGPLLDRIDLQVELPALKSAELFAEGTGAESSSVIRQRVVAAQARQEARRGATTDPRRLNGSLKPKELMQVVRIDEEGRALLRTAIERLGLSARAYDRVRRVARTIADLEGCEAVASRHLGEALQFRCFDRPLNG